MPVTNNQTLGRGRLYFDKFAAGTLAGSGFRYFGNSPEFNVTSESENLDHFSDDEGIRVKDKSVLLELNRTGTFTTDNISVENLALFFLGEASAVTQASAIGETETITVTPGLFYQLGVTALLPQGVAGVENVVVEGTGGTPTYVEGTDYRINEDTGLLEIIEGGGISAGDIDLTYDVKAATFDRVVTAAEGSIKGALKFVTRNPEGKDWVYDFPYVEITPNGDFALKGDDWQSIPFNVEVLKLSDTVEAMYLNGKPVYS